MKINFKLFTLFFILIIATTTLCGCAQVNFVTYNHSDGSIDEYIQLNLNSKALIEHGYNPAQVMLEIKTDSYTEANLLLEYYQDKLSIELKLGNLNNAEYTELFYGVKIFEEERENNEYVIGFNYATSSIYKKYYELVNNVVFTNSPPEQVKKLFYTKTYYRGTTNFGDYSLFYNIYNYYANSKFADISPQNTTLTYSYSVNTKRMHSDANKITMDSDGNYIHTWNVSPNNPNREITFYTISANRGVWIATCTGIGLAVCIILCCIAFIKHKKYKPNTPTNLQQNQTSETPPLANKTTTLSNDEPTDINM